MAKNRKSATDGMGVYGKDPKICHSLVSVVKITIISRSHPLDLWEIFIPY